MELSNFKNESLSTKMDVYYPASLPFRAKVTLVSNSGKRSVKELYNGLEQPNSSYRIYKSLDGVDIGFTDISVGVVIAGKIKVALVSFERNWKTKEHQLTLWMNNRHYVIESMEGWDSIMYLAPHLKALVS